MQIKEKLFRQILVTKGRKTGREHAVMLRAVNYNEKIYFSRHKPDGDWFQNIMVNPQVKIKYNDSVVFLGLSLIRNIMLFITILLYLG